MCLLKRLGLSVALKNRHANLCGPCGPGLGCGKWLGGMWRQDRQQSFAIPRSTCRAQAPRPSQMPVDRPWWTNKSNYIYVIEKENLRFKASLKKQEGPRILHKMEEFHLGWFPRVSRFHMEWMVGQKQMDGTIFDCLHQPKVEQGLLIENNCHLGNRFLDCCLCSNLSTTKHEMRHSICT